MEGTEMRRLVFMSADVYCQKLNNQKCTLALFLYTERKRGKEGKQRERQRQSVCERERGLLKDGHWRLS
jgi:hypothetical protein